MTALVVNDVHIGVNRQAGTTPASQQALRTYVRDSFGDLIFKHLDKDLIIAGDLFDGFTVEIQEILETVFTLSGWLRDSEGRLILIPGNHDIGKRNDKMSSFGFLCSLLTKLRPGRVIVPNGCLTDLGDNIYAIPHCMNQDLFNIELEKALHVPDGILILHANVDNGFAERSDHSLNVDSEWLTKLSRRHMLLFAHEHQGRTITYGGNAIKVLGNQWPSSVADCLSHGEAQKSGRKYAHIVHTDEILNGDKFSLEPIETWWRDGDFEEMDWLELRETGARFIRITGEASSEQAADVINTIARYRQNSDAFVITNGVSIAGVQGMEDLTEIAVSQVRAVNVLEALLEHLTPEEGVVVKELLA